MNCSISLALIVYRTGMRSEQIGGQSIIDAEMTKSTEQQLLEIYRMLGPGDQATLQAFAEFLRQRVRSTRDAPPAVSAEIPEPTAIARPPRESVVAGLKRLSQTYPMLSKTEMLNATSERVARHIMSGDDSAAVIDELEDIFREHYRRFREQAGQS